MKYICVFCGSSNGNEPVFADLAYQTGVRIAQRGYGLVYGGAHVGLMGRVADGAIDNGAEVVGVLPEFMKDKELQHPRLTKLYSVESMHDRKTMMHQLSDAVMTLPGGFGTMEELFEMLTWAQLSLHTNPIGLLNVGGYYDPLVQLTETMIGKGFLPQHYKDLLLVDSEVDGLIDKLEQYTPPVGNKWHVVK